MSWGRSLPRWLLIPVIAGQAYACQAENGATDSSFDGSAPSQAGNSPLPCAPGRAGCPCDVEGATAACGTTAGKYGDYVTCSIGRSTCKSGNWGACAGATLVSKSLAGTTLGSGGLHVLSQVVTSCNDHCDPACNAIPGDPTDVDAAGVTLVDAGTDAPAVTLAQPCAGLACQVALDCPPGSPTTLTGKVLDPAGQHPIYNATVYIPNDPNGNLPPISTGATCDSCPGTAGLQAAAMTQTAADGTFTLTNVPTTDLAPNATIPLVVQLGEWRRQTVLGPVPRCAVTAVDPANSRLPTNGTDGRGAYADLPKMAIATGASDPFECLLLKIGIDPKEFQQGASGGAGHVDYYRANGADYLNGAGQGAPPLASLVGSTSTLANYDLVILPCTGSEDPDDNQYAGNLAAYADSGGRVFTTHFGFTWLATPAGGVPQAVNPATGMANPFFGVANWKLEARVYPAGEPVPSAIDTTTPPLGAPFARGQALDTLLQTVGGLDSAGLLDLDQPRHDVDSVNAPAVEFVRHDFAAGDAGAPAGSEPFFFSFDTPSQAPGADAGADGGSSGGACGRVGFGDFHVSSSALVDPESTGACFTDADCGFTSTCQSGTVGTCQVTTTCFVDADCGAGQTCRFKNCWDSCTSDADCSGPLCVNGICQGCLDDSFCQGVTCAGATTSQCTNTGTTFPLDCRQSPMTAQEEALEFLLFDTMSCISPPTPMPVAPMAGGAFQPATFTEDFTTPCAPGYRVVWRQLDWDANVPPTASIVFSAQTVETPGDGGPPDFSAMMPLQLATDTTSTVPPGDAVFIDTPTIGAFSQAMPPVISRDNLRLIVTLNPTSDQSAAPELLDWQVQADCIPSE